MWSLYKNVSPATIGASITAANMWKNSLKNVESDKNKILYETLIDIFYSETVLNFWISLVVFEKNNYLGATLFLNTTRTDLALNHSLRGESYDTVFIYYSRIKVLISIPTLN